MDIPKHPINSDNQVSSKASNTSIQQVSMSNLQDLKLEAGKTYTGKVISQKQDSTPSSNNSTQTLANSKEWLVQLKGQTILISSEKNLKIGQKLLLQLDPASTPNKPSLIAQLANSNLSKNTTQPSETLIQAFNSSIKTETASGRSQLDKALIPPLIQAINTTLDKQISLQRGFNQLSALATNLSLPTNASQESNALRPNPKLINSIKQDILNSLPKLNDILPSKTSSQTTLQTQGNYLKQILSHSGLFFEQNLTSKPEAFKAFQEQLNNLRQLLNQSAHTESQLSQAHQSARDKIQQTIEALLQLASNTQTKSSTSKLSHDHTQQPSDLKATLISASALLAKQLATELSESELKSLFFNRSTDTTLVSPFVFPMINNTRINQSKGLFDSQELTTGQLLKLLAGMMHKLQFNQLNSLMQSNTGGEGTAQQTWFFELPILNPNQTVQTFNFRLDKEQKESKNEQNTNENELQWKLLLSFDLDSLGPIYVQITLLKNIISPVLWADQQSTLELLEKESAYFRKQLENIGLNVSDILCQKGQPTSKQTQLDRHLVDTKA